MDPNVLRQLRNEIKILSSPEKAKSSEWFFKTGKGQYGEGDVFIGLTVPEQRKIAREFNTLQLSGIEALLQSKIHEERLIALFILVSQFTKEKDLHKRHELFEFYLLHKKYVNNWDLVDASAHKIVGEYLVQQIRHSGKQPPLQNLYMSVGESNYKKDAGPLQHKDKRKILYQLAQSESIWNRRIAIISTAAFIARGSSQETFEIANILLHDKEDLIQKAVGWMLREVGKRISKEELKVYLQKRYKEMPRTMLRYAIEHFHENARKAYLKGEI